ncbi:hypothetical protein EDD15DRAFT_2197157 [Pisolithus albus]|nr:hypothetical protein EDD15DRAFT_2197157 [Pisolithus albus]
MLLWEAIGPRSPFRTLASHALHFYVTFDGLPPAATFAHLLAIISSMANNRLLHRFKGISYTLTPARVIGTLLCTNQLQPTGGYMAMFVSPLQPTIVNDRRFYICTFPDDEASIATKDRLLECMSITEYGLYVLVSLPTPSKMSLSHERRLFRRTLISEELQVESGGNIYRCGSKIRDMTKVGKSIEERENEIRKRDVVTLESVVIGLQDIWDIQDGESGIRTVVEDFHREGI